MLGNHILPKAKVKEEELDNNQTRNRTRIRGRRQVLRDDSPKQVDQAGGVVGSQCS